MMATIMNARVLQDALRSIGVKANALAPHVSFYFAEPFVASRGIGLLERGEVVICGGGTESLFYN